MHMDLPQQSSRRSIGQAIRALERQNALRLDRLPSEAIKRRDRFMKLLDSNATCLFEAVAQAAAAGERRTFVAQIPSFDAEAGEIFGSLLGRFDPDLANEWLQRRDLAHIFRIEGRSIFW